MMPEHLQHIEACRFLPVVDTPIRAASMKQFSKSDRSSAFYAHALRCAQSLWLQGFPAQAMLQMNRAFGAELQSGDVVLIQHPLPYAAMIWVIQNRLPDQFIGNPRRHFQHLATRMTEPRREQRSWRAWGCWWLVRSILPESEFPGDQKQLDEESVVEPSFDEIARGLNQFGIAGEVELWKSVAEGVKV